MSDDREINEEERTTRRRKVSRRVVLRAGRAVEVNARPEMETR